jgi:Holliday junction resolvase-like predicted endonuclease
MQRRINRRQQGDLGEASAIEWLTSCGGTVFAPLGHSPDVDLIAEAQGRIMRVQVKTSTQVATTPNGHLRSSVNLATLGGNRSWSGVAKQVDPSRFDYLYVHTGDGRRWWIPSIALEAGRAISLGGPKYSEYEIEPGRAIDPLVYIESRPLESRSGAGEYPSGQRTAAVNRQAQPSQVRILPPPFRARAGFPPSRYDRKSGKSGSAIVNQKRRVTLPRQACVDAGICDGDRVRVGSWGDGRLLLERIEPPPDTLPGSKGQATADDVVPD